MELTWIAIAASLLMGGGALLIFIWAVRNQQFQSFEDVKYQVFWSDQETSVKQNEKLNRGTTNGSSGNGNQVQ